MEKFGSGIQDKHPGPATLLIIYFYINQADIQYLYILLVEYRSFETERYTPGLFFPELSH